MFETVQLLTRAGDSHLYVQEATASTLRGPTAAALSGPNTTYPEVVLKALGQPLGSIFENREVAVIVVSGPLHTRAEPGGRIPS